MKDTSFKIDTQAFYLNKTDLIVTELASFIKDSGIVLSRITKIDCHIDTSSTDEFNATQASLSEVMQKSFKKKMPAHSLIANKSITDKGKAIINIHTSENKNATIEYKVFQKHHYTVITNNDEKIVYSGGIQFNSKNDCMRDIQFAFDFAEQLLDHEEMHFGHIAYQTNYLANLYSQIVDPTTNWTNAQALNEIRTFYFDPTLFKNGYPLQNDLNVSLGGCMVDFVACQKDGFPTAQFFSNSNEHTQLALLPNLNMSVFNGTITNKNNHAEQVKELTTITHHLFNESPVNKKQKIEVLRIYLDKEEDIEPLNTLISKELEPKKLLFLVARNSESNQKIHFEGVASLDS